MRLALGSDREPAEAILGVFGLRVEDVDLDMTIGEIGEIAVTEHTGTWEELEGVENFAG